MTAAYKRKRLFVMLLLLALLVAFFYNAGNALVEEQQPAKADIIVVLMGSGPDRVLCAVDLYKQNYAGKILMVENWQPGYERLKSLGVSIPRDAKLAAMVGMQMGVPEEAFVILPGDARSTQDEARIIRDYLQENKVIDSCLLVTSKYHSARAAGLFRWMLASLDRKVELRVCPTPYDDFNPAAWWRSREDAKRVVMEYAKWANFYLLDRWR
ncbi:MAG: YdcF family protein [Parabacteroides sp.]|nr:YdcF family protein [Parabacteroides sp.]